MIQAGNELLRHASSISPNGRSPKQRRVRSRSRLAVRLRTGQLRLIFIFSLAAIITVTASGLGCSSKKPEEPTVSVQVVPVKKATIEQTVTSEAVLYPLAQAAIVPKISAPIKAFYVNRGSKVHAGQLLATLENRDWLPLLKTTRELTIRHRPRIRSRPPLLCRKRSRRRKVMRRRPR